MYGLLHDVTLPVQTVVSQQTYIPNLFMTGQSTNSHGMLGVTNGAVLTCGKLIGLNAIIHSINEI
jgi:all-trans-retinol 13,14-reductase